MNQPSFVNFQSNQRSLEMSKSYSIKDAAKELNLSEVYIRRQIQQHALNSHLVRISPDSDVMKHMIDESALIAWRSKTSSRTQREDGRNKFTLYANKAELAKLEQFIKTSNLGVILNKANPTEVSKKRYQAQKAKKAAKRLIAKKAQESK